MTLSRVLGSVGRALITSGCMVLLFVAYQLWGTGFQTDAAQGNLEDEFEALLASAAAEPFVATPTEVPAVEEVAATNDGLDDAASEAEPTAVPTPEPPPVTQEFLELLYPDNGASVARIVIEDIDVDYLVVEGVQVEDLRKGPGHYRTTPMPGQPGNASIAGHRTTYGAPFNRVDELEPGDIIKVQTLQGNFEYRVMEQPGGVGHIIVSPSATEVLSDFGDNRLTLTACHPKFSAAQRIIVFAELIGEPVERLPRPEDWTPPDETLASEDVTANEDVAGSDGAGDDVAAGASDDAGSTEATESELVDDTDVVISEEVALDDDPEAAAAAADGSADAELTGTSSPFSEVSDDFGEGLSGDRDAIMPAITWGIAAMALWLTGKFIGRRWMRLPAYAVFLVPFALALWATFVNIDQALPSY